MIKYNVNDKVNLWIDSEGSLNIETATENITADNGTAIELLGLLRIKLAEHQEKNRKKWTDYFNIM